MSVDVAGSAVGVTGVTVGVYVAEAGVRSHHHVTMSLLVQFQQMISLVRKLLFRLGLQYRFQHLQLSS